jgi:formyltetrahydrofolate hydrolase
MDLKPSINSISSCSFTKDNKLEGETNRITQKTHNFIVLALHANHQFDFAYENKIINIHHSLPAFPELNRIIRL